jgi:deoxyribonuclease-4
VFAKSPRQWKGPINDPTSCADFDAARRAAGLFPLFTHTAYLINLSSRDPLILERSIEALADELMRADAIGADGVVSHIGTIPDGDIGAAVSSVAQSIRDARKLAGEPSARLLLENTAGAGTTFGSTLEELGLVIETAGLPIEVLGVCIDTCHAFARGYELDTEAGWREFVDLLGSAIGFDRLGCIHANDCSGARGDRKDRHAWIGEGGIGDVGFRAMLCAPELSGTCAITEMPGDPPEKDIVNLRHLAQLRDSC